MYICKECGGVFSEPWQDKNHKYTCPDCGHKNFERANQCKICKEYFVSINSYDKYCCECVESALDQLRRAIDRHVDPDYVELLRDEYDDIDYIMRDEDG